MGTEGPAPEGSVRFEPSRNPSPPSRRRRARDWIREHRTGLKVTSVVLVLIIIFWVLPFVPFIPVTRGFQVLVVSDQELIPLSVPEGWIVPSTQAQPLLPCGNDLPFNLNFTLDYVGTVFVGAPQGNGGGTITVSFAAQNQTPFFLLVEFGTNACGTTARSGDFQLASGHVNAANAIFSVESPSPASLYVNGSLSVIATVYGAL
jgi:hypothetical protein